MAKDWGMAFNTSKCKVMHIGRQNPGFQYRMGDELLTSTELERDIGVLVINNLKPSEQYSKAANSKHGTGQNKLGIPFS